RKSRAKAPMTRSARPRAATWGGSPRTSSGPNSVARCRRWKMARSPRRSGPRPAGTSCSAWRCARPAPVTTTGARRSASRSASASWRMSGIATSARCAAKPMSTSAWATHRPATTAADMSRPRLALVPGEPAGVGPELCVRAAQRSWGADLLAFGDPAALQDAASRLVLPLTLLAHDALAHAPDAPDAPGTLRLVAIPAPVSCTPGQADPRNAASVIEALTRAASACDDGRCHGIVTGPAHNATINLGGIAYSGTTELLAAHAGCEVVMMLANDVVRVALATTHLPLREVADAITPTALERVLRILHRGLQRDFGIDAPRIAVL